MIAPLHPGRPHVVVVGGGITGLCAAHRLIRSANGWPIDVTLFESSDRLGGKLLTVGVGGVRVEAGADSFVVRKPWAVELCKELGLGGELVVPAATGAFVWTRGRLVPLPPRSAFGIPSSAIDMLRWPGLSLRGRLRAATEFLHRVKRSDQDESIGSLLARRMGHEATRVLSGPLLAGLHAGDPDRLSVRATFPELVTWEQGHDSLIRGARAALEAADRQDQRRAIFTTVWGGLSRLVDTLENSIAAMRIRRGEPVLELRPAGNGYLVKTSGSQIRADTVVLTTPAFEAARLLQPWAPEAARELGGIAYASTATVTLVYPEGSGGRLPQGSGFVVPQGERTITACTWLSRKWPQEDDANRAVVRCFVGRAGDEAPLRMPDEDLIATVRSEAERAAPMPAAPDAVHLARWERAMPQYEVGHLDRLARIDTAITASPGVFLAGSAYRGVGIADCVRQGEEAAVRVREFLESRPAPSEPLEREVR